MRITDSIRDLCSGLAAFIARVSRGDEFTCSDCERWEQCGLPPNENCVFRAAQLEDGGWKSRKRARALARIVGPS